jgi:hypothetical protein
MAETDTSQSQRVSLPAFTMFGDTPVYSVDGEVLFGLMRDSVIPDPSDQIYIVTQAGERRLDAISSLFYGTPKLWWVVALVNRLIDPLLGATVGTRLRIPTKQRLSQEGILSA